MTTVTRTRSYHHKVVNLDHDLVGRATWRNKI